jgi:signal transduction histidine kinase
MVGTTANISHEFRALVTLIRGPLEEELAERALTPARRERLKTLHRNFLRLLQLVNTLFDIAHVAPERREVPAKCGKVDLAATTTLLPALHNTDHGEQRSSPAPRERRATATELERANQELEAFNYSVSHDLRGPLRALRGFSQILLDEHAHALDDQGRELLEQIHGSARRMGTIVDDLLILSSAGRAPLQRDALDVTAIARRIAAELRAREPARTVDVRVADGLTARADGRLVSLALENLLGNAWKFTARRPWPQVIVDGEPGGVFAVRDNGVGFDMTHSEHLFEPFQRLHTSHEFEGTGIGLAIVRRVIERHGGRVWAEGAVDHGATIRFTLVPGTRQGTDTLR